MIDLTLFAARVLPSTTTFFAKVTCSNVSDCCCVDLCRCCFLQSKQTIKKRKKDHFEKALLLKYCVADYYLVDNAISKRLFFCVAILFILQLFHLFILGGWHLIDRST